MSAEIELDDSLTPYALYDGIQNAAGLRTAVCTASIGREQIAESSNR